MTTLPACADMKACVLAEAPHNYDCYPQTAPFVCSWDGVVSMICSAGNWVCPSGTGKIGSATCMCLGPPGPGFKCTDAGMVPLDAGGG